MGSDHGVFSKRSRSRRLWLREELTLQTLADTTYVRLMQTTYPDDAVKVGNITSRAGGAGWSWLKRPVGEVLQLRLTKSRSLPSWGRPAPAPAANDHHDQFHFDRTKRWPQGW